MELLDRVRADVAKSMRQGSGRHRKEMRYGLDDYLNILQANQFVYNGANYAFGLNQSWTTQKIQEISNTLPGYRTAIMSCPPAFAAQLARAVTLSQARFAFRNKPYASANPRNIFGTSALQLLETPWVNGNTSDLLSRMEWHAGLAGNAYVTYQMGRGGQERLRVLRPDWVAIVYGSDLEPEDPMHALDGEVVGYLYCNGGFNSGSRNKITTILPENMAHWAPIPDPTGAGIGMSWITPAVRDIQADGMMTQHKLMFFGNAATPNLVVKGIPAVTKDQFTDIVDTLESQHSGLDNAYKTLYLTAGADVTVIGANLSEMAFDDVQGKGETRISSLSRVPAQIVGLSEGLKGSSLNAATFGQARRSFADMWVFPTLQDLCNSLSVLVKVPPQAELWFDTTDVPVLREDLTDQAAVTDKQASTVGQLCRDGFTAESAIKAVVNNDMTLLKQIPGWISVQLRPQTGPENNPGGNISASDSTAGLAPGQSNKNAPVPGQPQPPAVPSPAPNPQQQENAKKLAARPRRKALPPGSNK